ncbi:MAG: TrlF family AAA-like ATPase [Desulfovibrionaceae bacterium]
MLINHHSKNRGSEWRQWDLHVHSPASQLEPYNGNYEDFIKQLSSAEAKVIGINDYYSIEGYKEIISRIDNIKDENSKEIKRALENIQQNKTLFPVVELRMNNIIIAKNSSQKAIDFHIIFNNKNEEKYLESIVTFIKGLKDGLKQPICSSYGTDDIKGLTVDYDACLKELKGNDILKTNHLIWLPYNEYGGIDPIPSDELIKQHFIKRADILGSSNQKQRDFFLWKCEKWTEEQYREWLGVKKPCIKGSDSHKKEYPIGCLQDEKSNPMEKYCWIKAEPTFEGLKQIVYEPEGRVRIEREEPECGKSGYNIVDSITIKHKDFVDNTIYFNKNLNVIIGGRSSGKSLFLSILAAKLKGEKDTTTVSKYDNDYFNEIVKATIVGMKDSVTSEENSSVVDFMPQGYIHTLVSSKKDDLQKRLSDIIKEDKDNSAILNNIDGKLGEEKEKRKKIFDTLYIIKKEKQDIQEKIGKLPTKKQVDEEITKLKKTLSTLTTSLTEENINILNDFEDALSFYVKEIELKENLEAQLNKVKNCLNFQDFELSFENDDMQRTLQAKYKEIMKNAKSAWCTYINEEKDKLTANKNEFMQNKKEIEENDEYKTLKAEREKSTQYLIVDTKLKEEEKKLQEIESLTKKLEELDKCSNSNIKQLCSLIQNMQKCYNSLQNVHKKSLETTITIEAEYVFKDDVLASTLSEYLHATNINNKGLKSNEDTNENRTWKIHTLEDYKNALDELCTFIYQEKYTLKKNKDYQDLFQALLVNIDRYFGIVYRIYENDNGNKEPFEMMSEGKQGIVFLKVLLEFERNAQYPLLLDQPEDDLDNRSIYTELVRYIKQKKIERQIFIVTHNANVVLGTDAEHVIVANQHGSTTPNKENKKFQYVSGAIENTCKDETNSSVLLKKCIREYFCDILEGGEEAFKEREHKYALKATK